MHRQARFDVQKPVGLWGAYVMGLAFALGWTPCIGPILAAILAVAASEATLAKGAGLLAVYSLGLGIPFIIAAFAVEPFAAFVARFRSHLRHVERAMGGLLVLTGIAFLTGFFTAAQQLAAGDVSVAADAGLGRQLMTRAHISLRAKTPTSAARRVFTTRKIVLPRIGLAPGRIAGWETPAGEEAFGFAARASPCA